MDRTASLPVRLICLLAAACWMVCSPALYSQAAQQPFDATHLRVPTDLDTKWLVHAGDDPAFAKVDFDDSQWALFDPHNSIETVFKGIHPEVIWYRLRVKVDPTQTGLALREWKISRAFEVYVNGERLIASGQIAPFVPYTFDARVLEPIPDRMVASGGLLIALRVHISTPEWTSQGPGYFATNLTIGQTDTLYREDWLAVIGEKTLDLLDSWLRIALGLVALVLFASQRRQTEYLWIFAMGVLTLVEFPEPAISAVRNVPLVWQFITVLFRLVSPFVWVSVYFSIVHQRIGWRWRTILAFAGVTNVLSGLNGVVFSLPLPAQLFAGLPFVILLSVVIPIVLAIHFWRGNREAGILLIPIILFSLYIYAEVGLDTLFQFPAWRPVALRGLDLIDRIPAGPFSVSLDPVSGILSTLSLAVIILLRSSNMSRRQALLESELAAAQQVQQVLLPDQIEMVPGFTIDAAYEPAQQVGGDYFQVVPAHDGGLVVVVGDVAGKGLPAAMLVSVLVGAIRATVQYTEDPAELLESLNERMMGRANGGFSTALAAHIAASGLVTIANAGHLSPYLDGREVELAGALPLGVVGGARYKSSEFQLGPGSRLTFYSDGVVEAQNQKGELLGFERGRELSTERAAAIVAAAQKFGQCDDITVVTIEREAAIATAA